MFAPCASLGKSSKNLMWVSKMKHKDEMTVCFYHGSTQSGEKGRSESVISTEILDGALVRVSIEHMRDDICDPIGGFGTDLFTAFADMDESELDTLIGMLETCKSKLKQD